MEATTLSSPPIMVSGLTVAWVPWRVPEQIDGWTLHLSPGFDIFRFSIDNAYIIDAYRIAGFPSETFNQASLLKIVALAKNSELGFVVRNRSEEPVEFQVTLNKPE